MSAKFVFRILVVLMAVTELASLALNFNTGDLREDWQQAVELSGSGGFWELEEPGEDADAAELEAWNRMARAQLRNLIQLLAVVLVVAIYTWLGLFFFWPFARQINVALTALYIGTLPWAGLTVTVPVEEMLSEMSMLVSGAVMALSFAPPVRDLFRRRVPLPPLPA